MNKLRTLKDIENVYYSVGNDNVIYGEDIKDAAIEWIKDIQSGAHAFNMELPERLKGRLARNNWDDDMFSYGMEYGAIWALYHFFNLELSDLYE